MAPVWGAVVVGRKGHTNVFSWAGAEDRVASAIEHTRMPKDHQLLVVAPATADLLAKFAHGLADDLLTTTYLAFTGTVVLAPAMNTNMWNHVATQTNMEVLRGLGHVVVEPEEGLLARGKIGPVRLAA